MPKSYDLLELPWSIAGRLKRTGIAVTQFETKLVSSGLSARWQSRCDMLEATRPSSSMTTPERVQQNPCELL